MGLEQKVIEAIYDGRVLWPREPINLEPDTRVKLTIEVANNEKKKKIKTTRGSFLQIAQDLKLDGPRDWSRRFEEYLYGER